MTRPISLRLLPTIVYMGLIFYVSSIPAEELPLPPGLSDWLLHFVEYLLLGFLLMYSASAFTTVFTMREYFIAGGVGITYAISDEWHQSFVPGRDVSMGDFLFDSAGIVTAMLIVFARSRRRS